jgi:translation initiation factor 2B subunit (eIF-2B alpha/beta/delta family)
MSLTTDLASYAKGISDDLEHGASHILKVAAGSLHTALLKNPQVKPEEVKGAVKEYAVTMIHGKRQMACVLNFSNNLLLALDSARDDSKLYKELKDFSIEVSKGSAEALSRIASHSKETISGSSFMTYSRSTTLLSFLTTIKDRDGLIVYAAQSRPGSEGRLLAGELAVAGVRSVLIEDSEAMRYLPDTSALLVGADAFIPSGVVNKAGTRMVALAARELGIPVYCLAENIKIWPFDEPILSSIDPGSSKMKGSMPFELIPGSTFDRIILDTGPTTFDSIAIGRKEIEIAPEIRQILKI